MKPKKILEFGTGGGYSTLCMAKALDDNGIDSHIYTIDRVGNDEKIDRFFKLPDDVSPQKKKISNKEVNGIIYVSQSPSKPLPTRACLLQDKLGLGKNSLAFDINQGCSGFVYALSVATSLIKNDCASRIIILCADYYSKYIPVNDRTSRPIFSDAAAAVIIEKSKENKIEPFIFKTAGDGSEFLTVKEKNGINNLYMDGPAVLKFSLNLVPEATKELLEKANYSMEDIDKFIYHQASAVVLNKLQKKLNIPDYKHFDGAKGPERPALVDQGIRDIWTDTKIKGGGLKMEDVFSYKHQGKVLVDYLKERGANSKRNN